MNKERQAAVKIGCYIEENTKKPLPGVTRQRLFILDQRRPTLTGGDPQLPSAQKSLTSVFGMGTGVASLPSSLDSFSECLRPQNWTCDIEFLAARHVLVVWLSPRSISIRQLHASPRFHSEPIYLIVFEGSYLLAQWEISS